MTTDDLITPSKPLRRLALSIALKVIGVGVLDFLLLRIWGPDLINLHQDWALFASLACLVLALVATGWLAWRVWRDWALYARGRRPLARIYPLNQDFK